METTAGKFMQIVSDVHLEYRNGKYPHIPRLAPVIGLLGDIGRPFSKVYLNFIGDLSRRFDHVIVIAGNHEYFSPVQRKWTVYEIRDCMRAVCGQFANVHFLENESVTINTGNGGCVRILGATLWTRIPRELWPKAVKNMNDYRICFVERYSNTKDDVVLAVRMTPEHTSFWHEESVKWIKDQLEIADTPTIVVTHHAPYCIGTSDPKYAGNLLESCYATDLSRIIESAPSSLIAWAYGHTHHPFDELVHGVRIVSNPAGYPGELPTEKRALQDPPCICLA